MKRTIILATLTMIFGVFLFSFLVPVCAAGEGGSDETSAPSGGSGSTVTLDNPLGVNDPRLIIGNVIKAILGITGSLALGVFILGGLTWVTSAGNDEKIKKGKDMIMWATFGLVVIFASYALVTFVLLALTGGT
jgi:hypothetical protein